MIKFGFIKVLLVFSAILLLAGCPQRTLKKEAEVTEISPPSEVEQQQQQKEKQQQAQQQKPPVEVVPPPPKMMTFNWPASITPMIESMLGKGQIKSGSLLLLDHIVNKSNGVVQTAAATQSLYQVMSNYTTFKVIPEKEVNSAKKAMGISGEDRLGTLSLAIGLSRYLHADYVLYSNLKGEVNNPTLNMQLLQVSSGELIWSDSGPVQMNP